MPRTDDYDDTSIAFAPELTRRDLEQILTAMRNRGDDKNSDPRWLGLYGRLAAMADEWDRR